MNLFKDNYHWLGAYVLIIILTLIQIPAYLPAMRDFDLEVSIAFVVLYVLKLTGDPLKYFIGLLLYFVISLISQEAHFEIILNLCGYLLFVQLLRRFKIINCVYLVVIIMTLVAYLLTPFFVHNTLFMNKAYLQIIFEISYIKYILVIFPAYFIFEWSLNAFIIEYIIRKRN